MFRFRTVKRVFGAVLLVAAAIVTTDHFADLEVRRLRTRLDELAREKAELRLYADRLSASRRVAQVNVLEQRLGEQEGPITVLRWQQIGPTGSLGAPEILELRGEQVYFEAWVVKFEHEFVGRGETGRETSLAMFRRAFGDRQMPASGLPLDQTAPPDPAGAADPTGNQARLWQRFWDLIESETLAEQYGVRVAQCEAPSARLRAGEVWEVSLDSAGGLNLRLTGHMPRTNEALADG